jgi:tripartite-type tricarboxylate transporter receptor subunit TctC
MNNFNVEKKMTHKKVVVVTLVILTTLSVLSYASDYPNKPITAIVPWGAGGGTDLNARVIAKEAEKYIDQPIVVVNREGATGTIGVTEASRAKPDGYTILFGSVDPMCSMPHLIDVEYSIDDFRGIVGYSFDPSSIAVRTDSPWQTLEDLLAEKDSGKILNRGHSGFGGIHHMMFEMFFPTAGLRFRDVTFDSGAASLTALRGGHIDVNGNTLGVMVPSIESGEVRVLAVAAPERLDSFPDVPTFKEKGFDIDVAATFFLVAPKDTPDEIVDFLEEIFTKAAQSEAFKAFAEKRKLQVYIRDSEKIYEKVKGDYEKFGEIIGRMQE